MMEEIEYAPEGKVESDAGHTQQCEGRRVKARQLGPLIQEDRVDGANIRAPLL